MHGKQTFAAVVSTAAGLWWNFLTAVSTLKTLVDNCKIHARRITFHAKMDKPYEAPQGRLLPTLVVFVFVLAVLYTLFLAMQQFVLMREVSRVESQRLEIVAEINLLKEQQLEEIFVAQDLETLVEIESVEWSKVISKLKDLTPVTVFFSSYSAGREGELTLSALGDSYDAVADVIAALTKSSDFENVFVPSVTLGTTGEGQEVVSFSLTVNTVNK